MDSHPPKPTASAARPPTHCKTRILNLQSLDIPNSATDEEYRALYNSIVAQRTHESSDLQAAISSIQHGLAPPVAFPSETVYGLGHTATSTPGVLSIFSTKGRPSDNPLIVHASSLAHLERLINGPLPAQYQPLVQKYWPGPLTILLPVPKNSIFSPHIHPGQNTIAFRIPSSKYARFFIAATDLPIAGPSANSSGKPSPTTADHVFDDLQGKINFILDGGPCDVGVESTVVDGLNDPPLILRPGGVSLAEVRALGGVWARTAIGYKRSSKSGRSSAAMTPERNGGSTPTIVEESPAGDVGGEDEHVLDINGAPRAPGMKYRHYAPQGKLILFSREAVLNGRVREKLDDIRGSAVTTEGKQHYQLNIGIITRRWGAFAGLVDDNIVTSDAAPSPQVAGAVATNAAVNGNGNGNGKTAPPQQPLLQVNTISLPPPLPAPTSSPPQHSTDSTHPTGITTKLHEISLLGRSSSSSSSSPSGSGSSTITHLAHSLFSILRKFDELACEYIFAEMVEMDVEVEVEGADAAAAIDVGSDSNGTASSTTAPADAGIGVLAEAVVDRIEKAASERVEA